jgi:hypothetical protein
MSELRAHVVLLVDHSGVRPLAAHCAARFAASRGRPAPDESVPLSATHDIGRALLRYASQLGRVAFARSYADWTLDVECSRELFDARLDPVHVPATSEGTERAPVRLVVEALQSLYAGDEPDAFVLVTCDATMLPLVQSLRADGSEVVLVSPAAFAPAELREAADRFVTLEDVLAGVAAEPVAPRAWRAERSSSADAPASRSAHVPVHVPTPRHDDVPRRERPAHPTPVRSDEDFAAYDWSPFVRLIDELEHRLPFVGVRYLVNKVLGPHNCGVEDPRLKRDLINRAVDDGLIEMYPVGNVGDRADPVTACRLDRRNATVVAVLGETETPQPPPEEPIDATMSGLHQGV